MENTVSTHQPQCRRWWTSARRLLPSLCPRRAWFLILGGLLFLASLAASPARAQDHLIFCNRPEKIRLPGAYADAPLIAGRTYTIFFHYKNVTAQPGPLVIALQGSRGEPILLDVRKGVADAQREPPLAGRQAMARFLSAPEKRYRGTGGARFVMTLKQRQVASGVMTVRADQDARLRIYFRHNKWTVPGARVVAVDAPRRDIEIALSPEARQQYFRIGAPEAGMSEHLDGTYGMLYAFRVNAPAGRKVRVMFSPRGGQGGLVGSVGGVLRQSRIVGTAGWAVFCVARVGAEGMVLTTSPFGGVFYPVELMFQLL